jgi:Domain of unknown function (DUF5664)
MIAWRYCPECDKTYRFLDTDRHRCEVCDSPTSPVQGEVHVGPMIEVEVDPAVIRRQLREMTGVAERLASRAIDPPVTKPAPGGRKDDTGKLRYDLLPPECEEAVVRILTHGAAKYGENNWQNLDNFEDRYYAAVRRHLSAWRRGEKIDPDSGEPHLAHVMCGVVFLLWKELQSK